MNYYDVLGVSPEATQEEIQKAYKNLSKTNHPDAGGSHEEYIKITEAYRVLKDPVKRKHYDETGGEHEGNTHILSTILVQYLTVIIASDPYNIATELKSMNDNHIAEIDKKIKDEKSAIEKIEKFEKRIIKSPENNLFSHMTASMKQKHKVDLAEAEQVKDALNTITDYIEMYEFEEREKPETPPSFNEFLKNVSLKSNPFQSNPFEGFTVRWDFTDEDEESDDVYDDDHYYDDEDYEVDTEE